MRTHTEEDAIIAQAQEIKSTAYKDAETKWAATPRGEKTRPWPRCKDLTCNRTLICQGKDYEVFAGMTQNTCRGFDF